MKAGIRVSYRVQLLAFKLSDHEIGFFSEGEEEDGRGDHPECLSLSFWSEGFDESQSGHRIVCFILRDCEVVYKQSWKQRHVNSVEMPRWV